MKDGATTGERATTSASTAGRIRRYSVVEGIGERSSIILPHLYKGVERGKHGRPSTEFSRSATAGFRYYSFTEGRSAGEV
jgi:hypothetical protein